MNSSKRSSRLRKRSRKGYRPRLNKSSARTISSSKLWILLFVSLFPSQYLVAAGYVAHEVYKANVSEEDPSQMNPMDYARFRRDSAVFNAAVTNLQSLSRIASAITFEIGLMDKTLDPQPVITELLRMGDVKPNEITSLNPDDVKNSVNQLVDLPKNVAQTTPPNPVENRLVTLENMREVAAGFKDFANILGKAEYEESIQKVKDLATLKANFESLQTTVVAISVNFKNAQDEKSTASRLSALFDDMETLEQLSKDFKIGPIQEAKSILETSKFIDLIVLEKEFREKTLSFTYEDSHVEAVLGNFKNVYESSQTAKSSISKFETINKLMDSRDASHKQGYKHVSGLPLGPNDLSKLSRDIKSGWFKGRIDNNEDITENLGSAFQHFNGLVKELGDAESSWSPLTSDSERVEIGKVFAVNKQISAVSGDYKTFTDTMNALKDCDTDRSLPPGDFRDMETLKNNMNSWNELVKALSDFKDIEFFKDLQIKKHFDTTDLSAQEIKDLAKETFQKLSSDEGILNFKNKLSSLQTELEGFLKAVEDIKKLPVVDVSVTVAYVGKIMKGDHIKIYECLEQIQTKGFPVREAFKALEDIRSIKVANNAVAPFTKILQSIPHLTKADELAKEFSSFTDLPSISLKSPDISNSDSQALGMGVQGLSAIQKVFDAQTTLKTPIVEILSDPTTNKLSPEHQKGLEELKKVQKVFTDVDTFMNNFVQASRRKRATGFEDAKKIFDEAAKIPGAILDFKILRPAMEQLQKVKIFEALEKLEFDFSRFAIAEAGSHLTNLDKFFLEYAKKTRPTPPPPVQSSDPTQDPQNSATPPSGKPIILPPPNNPQNSANALTDTKATEEMNAVEKLMKENPYMFWGIGGFVLFLIFAFVIVVVCCCCCRKKEPKPGPDDLSDDDSSDEGDKGKGGKKEKTKKKRSTDNEEKKDDTSTEGPSTGGAPPPKAPIVEEKKDNTSTEGPSTGGAPTPKAPIVEEKKDDTSTEGTSTGGAPTPKAPIVEEKEKSLPLERTQKSLDDSMLLVRSTVTAMRGRFTEGVSPAAWAENLMNGHNGVGRQMMAAKDHEYKKEQRRKNNQHLIKNNLAKLGPKYKGDDPFININEMPYKNKIVLLGQGAQDGTEVSRDDKTGEFIANLIDTREKQYHVFDNYDVLVTAQLCQFEERKVKKVKGKDPVVVMEKKCGLYYPLEVNKPETYGKYEVTTTKIIDNPPQFMNGKVYSETGFWTIYKVKYMHLDDKVTKYIDIVLYRGFPDHGAMRHPEAAIALIQFLESYNSNMFIHCSAGVGRTGAMGAIMSGIEMCIKEEVNSINPIIQHVRIYRGSSIQNSVQLMFVIRAIGEALMQMHGFVQCDDLSRFDFFYQRVIEDVYDKFDEDCKKEKANGREAFQKFLDKPENILKLHDVEVEEVVKKDREHLKMDPHPVKIGVNTTTEPEKQDKFQDNFQKQQADLYKKACKAGKDKKTDEEKPEEGGKKEKHPKKSEQKNPEEKVKKSAEKDTKKKAASKMKAPSKEKGGASKEKDGAGKKKK